MLTRIKKWLAILGPGIFAVGYTIGTGSVTSMATAGSRYGLKLLWVLVLSCLFTGVLMEAYGRFAVVTGETSLRGIKRHLKFGKCLAWLVFAGVVMGQYTCLGGILAISSSAIYETAAIFFPSVPPTHYGATMGIAVAVIFSIYAILLTGRYSIFEKVLVFFVSLMAMTFLISMFVVWPSPEILAEAIRPTIQDREFLIMAVAFVGTTMAAPTFVTRPLLLREKSLTEADLPSQRWDAAFSAFLVFVISGAIMLVAAGALYAHGKDIVRVLDMAHTLAPVAGKGAVAFFMVGTLCAGMSSIFPILMVAPILISDYRVGRMEPRSRMFRVLCLIACLFGLIVPALGRNPVAIAIMTQISNVFVLPLTVAVIALLINRRDLMGRHKAGPALNTGLALAFIFSCGTALLGARILIGTLCGK